MFYIYANGKSIFQPMDSSLSLFSPKLTLEIGKAGSLAFQIPPTNKFYNALPQLSTVITVEMDDEEIFRGRVLTNNRTFNKIRTIYSEGALAYLVDSVQKGEKFEGKAHTLFRNIIDAHNARVEAKKRFVVGDITVENRDVLLAGKSDDIQDVETGKFDFNQIALNSIVDEWMNSLDYIETALIDFIGGYLRVRRQNGINYIDWLADYGNTAVQEIEFGKNLLDLTEEVSAEDVFTVLIPLGDDNLTIASVNNGSDELVDAQAVAQYGRIVKTHVFEGVNTAATLLENGQRFLANHINLPVTFTVKAVDMHLVDPNASPIRVGDRVHVTSIPHDVLDYLTCTKIEYDMENPANNTYTFGNPKSTLTERYRKDKKKNKGGGGGAAEAASEETQEKLDELFDAWINVDPSAGHIDLGTLYEKYKNDATVLKNQCGIDLDAPSGNINIKNLREAVDENTNEIRKSAARIDLINNDLTTKIQLIVARADSFEDLEAGHYAAITLRVDDVESAIDLKADSVNVESLRTSLVSTQQELTAAKDVLTKTCGIEMDASGSSANVNITTLKSTVDAQGNTIASHGTSINSLSSSLQSQINLEARHYNGHDERLAAVELKANANESSITLRAKTTYVNSELTKITGRLSAAEADISSLQADYANIDTIVANRIKALTINSFISSATIMTIGGLFTNACAVANSLTLGGKAVATQEWVINQLASYAKTTHYHQWTAIQNKPTSFTPSAHKHKFSTTYNLTFGHTHTTSSSFKPGDNTGGVANNLWKKTLSISGTTDNN